MNLPNLPNAACRAGDPERFHAPYTDLPAARRICAGCPERVPCLEYAMGDGTLLGLWAGTTEDERKAIRRERRTPPPAQHHNLVARHREPRNRPSEPLRRVRA